MGDSWQPGTNYDVGDHYRARQLENARRLPKRNRRWPFIGGSIIGGATIFFLAFLVGLILLNGWVAMVLWNWFIPETFHGAPRLDIAKAIGLVLVAAVFMPKPVLPTTDTENRTAMHAQLFAAAAPFLALLMGFIVHLFMH